MGPQCSDGRQQTGRESGGGQTAPRADQALGARCQAASPSGASPSDLHRCLRGLGVGHLRSLWTSVSGPPDGPTGRSRRSILRWPQGLADGQVQQYYTGRGLERVAVRVLYGKARWQHVLALLGSKQLNTSVVERHNGTSRLRNQRKVRKTLAFSKVRDITGGCVGSQWDSITSGGAVAA